MSDWNLKNLQREMVSHIRRRIGNGADTLSPIIDPPERLRVYAEGFPARVEESLSESFEAIKHILGRSLFHRMSHDYAQGVISKHYDLSQIGRGLAGFLKGYSLTAELPFLPDLARLEWAAMRAFHSQTTGPWNMSEAEQTRLTQGTVRLKMHESIGLVSSSWPIADLWFLRNQSRDSIDLEVENHAQDVLVYRNGGVVCVTISNAQLVLLEALITGNDLNHALAKAGQIISPGESQLIGEWFSRWVEAGVICGIRD